MFRTNFAVGLAVAATAWFAASMPVAHAQGKIVCWKDAAGKVIGCGDKVPPEYMGSGTRELDKLGNVRKTGESADEAAKRRLQEKEQIAARDEENKRAVAQKRQDDALLNTFSNVKEIDLKRDRELQALNNFITQQNAALKGANERLAEARKRSEALEKDKKPVPPLVKEDVARAEREKTRVESEIAANEKAKADITVKYAEYRARFTNLKGGEPAAAAPVTPAAPAAPAAAKK